MQELWEVLIECHLAKRKGKSGSILDREGIGQFITSNGLDDRVILDEKEKQPVVCICIYT
jgi:hypothetical protein